MLRPMMVGVISVMDMSQQAQVKRRSQGRRGMFMLVGVMRMPVRMVRCVCVCMRLNARTLTLAILPMHKMMSMLTYFTRVMMMVRHKPMPQERQAPQTKQKICGPFFHRGSVGIRYPVSGIRLCSDSKSRRITDTR